MRVLHCSAGNLLGGVESLLEALARHAAPGMESEFALCFEGRHAADLRDAGGIVHLVGPARFSRPWTAWRARRGLARVLDARAFDAVACHGCWPHALFGPVVRRAGLPLVFWLHDVPGGTHWVERRAARAAPDLAIAGSRFASEAVPRLFPGVPRAVVHPPVDLAGGDPTGARASARADLATHDGATVILTASRLDPLKGHAVLIEALGRLRDDPRWVAWIAGGAQGPGDGAYLARLREQANSAGIGGRVTFLGHRSDVPHLLAAADVLCQPNVRPEVFGIAFVEALGAGLPVVTTRIGGGAEVVTEACGVLVPPGDPAALADALAALIDDPAARSRLGSAGPARARALCEPSAVMAGSNACFATSQDDDPDPARPSMDIGRWHLLTGEYPPRPGGVGDYSALVAAGLAAAGAEVHVWTNGEGVSSDAPGVTVHRSTGGWSGADLGRLGRALDAFAAPRLLLVQYAPNAWGRRGLNLGFCRWLVGRRDRGDEVRVVFHEVWYPLRLRDRPTRWLRALGNRRMAHDLMDAASCAYVSIPAWGPLLRGLGRVGRKPIAWLPVPSNIPVVADRDEGAALRRRIASGGEAVIGSFGTFGGAIGAMLAEVMPPLLRGRCDRVGLLIGRGSEAFAARLREAHPTLAGRLVATGGLSPEGVSAHLRACDLLVQPYPDGVTSRRGSVMAGLAHGVATVSNSGALSEPIWTETGCVAPAPRPDPAALVLEAEALLADPAARARLGELGRSTYGHHFAIGRTIEAMVGAPIPGEATAPCRGT